MIAAKASLVSLLVKSIILFLRSPLVVSVVLDKIKLARRAQFDNIFTYFYIITYFYLLKSAVFGVV